MSSPHQRICVSARRRPRPGCVRRTQRGEQGSRYQPGDHPGADHCGVGRRGARFLNGDAARRHHRSQPRSGLGRHRPHPGAARAAEHGVRTVVGLQARQAPAIAFVRQLLSDGYVGEVLSTTMVGLSIPGDAVGQPNAYMLDKANGANLLTIPVGHSLDILNYVLGEFADLSAVSDLRRPHITIEETGERIVKTAADQIAVIGTLSSGATASVHVREAVAGGTGFLWEINGTDGTLRITADAAVPGIFPLTVAGAQGRNEPAELAVPTALTQKWPALTGLEGAPAFNVGRAYAAFAADIVNETHTVPDFDDAVRRHEVIDAIERSASTGKRVKV